ncbi:MAG: hypothetical protein HeimC3_53810 [Candidatus Heimdallarchaeota archaeon LC_3]|nr:MAG: hypothetical protein HeimC3_53810 [Candidatus Heimdallarchaeota archaeon LC_3]
MSTLTDLIYSCLSSIRVHSLHTINEAELEEELIRSLKQIQTNEKFKVHQQAKTQRERLLIPDIVINDYQIVIELKFLDKTVNDIYRVYYQAIKYSKIANEAVIFFIYDPKFIFTSEDQVDVETITKVKVILKH